MRFWRNAVRQARNEDGAVTLEALFWVVAIVTIFGLVVDASSLFYTQSNVLRTVQDANRNMSIGRFRTAEEAKNYVETTLAPVSPNASATVTVAGNVVTTRVTVPAGDLQLIGILAPLSGIPITVQGRHYIEDYGT